VAVSNLRKDLLDLAVNLGRSGYNERLRIGIDHRLISALGQGRTNKPFDDAIEPIRGDSLKPIYLDWSSGALSRAG